MGPDPFLEFPVKFNKSAIRFEARSFFQSVVYGGSEFFLLVEAEAGVKADGAALDLGCLILESRSLADEIGV